MRDATHPAPHPAPHPAAHDTLVLDPHAPDAAALCDHLARAGLRPRAEATAAGALAAAAPAAVVVAELVLPDGGGPALLRALRRAGAGRGAVVVVTREARLAAKLAAFDAGADDYVVKPCAWPEVVARVRAVLRRAAAAAARAPRAVPNSAPDATPNTTPGGASGDADAELAVDHAARCARRAGVEVRLRPKEYALLRALCAERGRVLTRGELLRTVWGYAEGTTTRTVDAHIAALRRKLEPRPGAPRYIVTVTGAGYRLVA